MAGVVTSVPDWTEDREWKVDCSPLVLIPDEKKASSDTEAADSEPTARARGRFKFLPEVCHGCCTP